MKSAILIIDMQEYFHKMDQEKIDKLVPNFKILLGNARQRSIPIIHIGTKYSLNKSNWPKAFINDSSIWCLEESSGTKFIEGIQPINGETIIYKSRFTAFYQTELLNILKTNDYDTLFITGYSADVCVRFTTMDAYNNGFNIYWLTDCIESAFEPLEKSIYYMQQLTRLKTISNDQFVQMMK
jgi:nicotinamidase-related amidase